MKNNYLALDPFIEHDSFQAKIIDDDKRHYSTKVKFKVEDTHYQGGNICFEMTVKKSGGIKLLIRAAADRKLMRKHRCEMDHFHPVIKRDTHIFDIMDLTRKEAQDLKDFLNDRLV